MVRYLSLQEQPHPHNLRNNSDLMTAIVSAALAQSAPGNLSTLHQAIWGIRLPTTQRRARTLSRFPVITTAVATPLALPRSPLPSELTGARPLTATSR